MTPRCLNYNGFDEFSKRLVLLQRDRPECGVRAVVGGRPQPRLFFLERALLVSSERVLLVGANGMLGRALQDTAPGSIELDAVGHRELDITNSIQVEKALREYRPKWVFNAAAYTAVDRAETESASAFRVNADGVATLANAARSYGVGIVHFGSDYVFDGASDRPYPEDATPNPLSVYGWSKLKGEEALQRSGARFLLVRTQWLFGSGGRCFPRTMLDRARRGQPTRVVADQFGSPTSTIDLAAATWMLLGNEGTVNVVNDGTASWHDVASTIFEAVGKSGLLTACSTSDFPVAATRPPRAILETTKLARLIGRRLPHWRDALHRFLASS